MRRCTNSHRFIPASPSSEVVVCRGRMTGEERRTARFAGTRNSLPEGAGELKIRGEPRGHLSTAGRPRGRVVGPTFVAAVAHCKCAGCPMGCRAKCAAAFRQGNGKTRRSRRKPEAFEEPTTEAICRAWRQKASGSPPGSSSSRRRAQYTRAENESRAAPLEVRGSSPRCKPGRGRDRCERTDSYRLFAPFARRRVERQRKA